MFVFPDRSTPLPFLLYIFTDFFSLPLYHNLEMKHEPSNVQASAEPWKRWYLSGFEIRQNKVSLPPFNCLGKDVNLFTEIWGLTYIFKQHRMFLQAICAVFGILSYCRRIFYSTAEKVSSVERACTELILRLGLFETIEIFQAISLPVNITPAWWL